MIAVWTRDAQYRSRQPYAFHEGGIATFPEEDTDIGRPVLTCVNAVYR